MTSFIGKKCIETEFKNKKPEKFVTLSEACRILDFQKPELYYKRKHDELFKEMTSSVKVQKRDKFSLSDICNYDRYLKAKKDFAYEVWTNIIEILDETNSFYELGGQILGKEELSKYSPKETSRIAKKIYSSGLDTKKAYEPYDIAINLMLNTNTGRVIKVNFTLIDMFRKKISPSEFNIFYHKYLKITEEKK